MHNFINDLKSKYILTEKDIFSLKKQINEAYSHLDTSTRASILANSIHDILNSNLKEFSKEKRDRIKTELIKNTLAKNNYSISSHDVLESCIKEEESSTELINNLTHWINNNIEENIDMTIIGSYLSNDKTIIDSPTEEQNINSHKKDDLEEPPIAATVDIHAPPDTINNKKKLILIYIAIFLLLVPFGSLIKERFDPLLQTLSISNSNSIETTSNTSQDIYIISDELKESSKHIPDFLTYKAINRNKLKDYLHTKNSLLLEEPYFSAIIDSAKEFNLNPLVLFSIAGHEQAFVPKDHPKSMEIVNNPYNVFKSWQHYNTDILDSSEIAARTVSNLLRDRPEEYNSFKWINRKYAEDKNWWKGVESIYTTLESQCK